MLPKDRADASRRSRPSSRRRLTATRAAVVLSFVVGLGGCEACGFRWGPPCEILLDYMCQRDLASRCDEVKTFLDSRLVDDDGAPLVGAARDQMCAAIDATPEVRNGYRFKAEQRILGTPDLDLSKSARDERFEAINGYLPGEKPDGKADAKADAKADVKPDAKADAKSR